MADRSCTVDFRDRVMVVTINRPERRNALHRFANHEMGEIFDEFERDPEHWVAILTGEGSQAFCAGADLKDSGSTTPENAVPPSGFGGLANRFERTKPVIAAVNGFAMGGGFELALACDIVIASERATFGLTEPLVGLAALGGGIQRLVREIGPKRAHAMLLTARRVTAPEGLQLGFVNEVVAHDELLPAARRVADEILRCSPASVRATKEIANRLDGDRLQHSIETMFELPAVRALFDSPDSKEGPRAFAERRTPQWSNP